jgi:hypothetical protein
VKEKSGGERTNFTGRLNALVPERKILLSTGYCVQEAACDDSLEMPLWSTKTSGGQKVEMCRFRA